MSLNEDRGTFKRDCKPAARPNKKEATDDADCDEDEDDDEDYEDVVKMRVTKRRRRGGGGLRRLIEGSSYAMARRQSEQRHFLSWLLICVVWKSLLDTPMD